MNKKLILSLISVFFLLISASMETFGRDPVPEEMLFNSAQGRDFWFAIPPNEADGQPLGNTNEISIDVYVTSSKNTTVTLEVPGLGYKVTKPVLAMKVTQFTTWNNETNFTWEVRESEKVLDMAIHVYADQPISVYVMNHREVTSDGWLGIPTSACGTDYMHLAYYDFYENIMGGEGEKRGGGFIITATEDNTVAKIQLRGIGGAYAKTLGGRSIGDNWTVNLNKGQIYCVMGDGKTRGLFDISGSRVKTNKPVSFISFHKRTLMPSFDLWNGRDNLIESLPPVSAWGKKYVTCEFKRNDHGDFFRIIAAEDNTNFKVKWYDIKTGKLISQRTGKLKAGQFMEYEEVFVERNVPNKVQSIRGTSVWEADKPVLVMQYSYSAEWDNASEFDPFMVLVVPEEQYIPGTVFQTPAEGSQFNTNWFNLVAIGDTNDPAQEKLKTLQLDGRYVWQMEPGFLFNNIPTTNMYWAKLPMEPGAHRIKGDTKFGGYIYGFSEFNSYGWPAAMAINKIDETDTLPPVLSKIGECGEYDIRATEFRTSNNMNDNPRQIDQGVAEVELMEGSYNFRLDLIDSLYVFPPPKDYHFRLVVVDKKLDGLALYEVTDKYGNIAFDTISYQATKISVNPATTDFGRVRLRTTKQMLAVLKNEAADSSVKITEIKLQLGKDYSIVWGAAPPEFTLAPGDTHHIWIEYKPTVESLKPEILDRDTLMVSTTCPGFSWPIQGRGVIPKIKVADWDAGTIVVNSKICKNSQTGTGLLIENPGTDTLVITDISGVAAPFEVSSPFTPALPIRIPEGQSVMLVDICYAPTAVGENTIDVLFKNNAEEFDSVSTWIGKAVKPGPYIDNYDWQEQRVLVDSVYYLTLKNGGNSKIVVTGANLGSPAGDFTIVRTEPDVLNGTSVDLQPDVSTTGTTEIKIFVKFTPQSEFAKHNTVVPTFDDPNITTGSVVGNLDGFGILPKIEVIGYEFDPPILINTTHPKTGYVEIKSTSETADLLVKSITDVLNPNDFAWLTTPPSDTVIKRGTSVKLPVSFIGKALGDRIAPVKVVSDAATGPDRNPRVDANVEVIGHVYAVGVFSTNIDYGDVLLCDQPEKTFSITNTSSADIKVTDLVLESGDVNAFQILSAKQQTITKLGTIQINVRFTPDKVGQFNAVVAIHALLDPVAHPEKDTVIYSTLKGMTHTVPIDFSLQRHDESEALQPGKVIPMNVTMTSGKLGEASVSHIKLEIVYHTKWLQFNTEMPNIKGSALSGNWTITPKEEKINEELTRLTIEAKANGTETLSQNGIIFVPTFRIMLNENSDFQPWIGAITTYDRDKCVITKGDTGRVVINTCVSNLRNVKFTLSQFSLSSIEPNPVMSNIVRINYSTGLKCMTRIEIYNSMGSLVRVAVDSEKDPGYYETSVSTEELSSGTYTVKMVSGPFTGSQQLVIVK